MYEEAFERIKGSLMIVYPMGLPEYEPAREILEKTEDTSVCIVNAAWSPSRLNRGTDISFLACERYY
jgi:hypothetical protein